MQIPSDEPVPIGCSASWRVRLIILGFALIPWLAIGIGVWAIWGRRD